MREFAIAHSTAQCGYLFELQAHTISYNAMSWEPVAALLQFGVFGFGLLQEEEVGVGVLP
jgi:hypothetical protein